MLSKLPIVLMGFARLGAAIYPETAHERTQSKHNDMHHEWYVISQYSQHDIGGIKGSLWFPSHRVI
jgi:hypothetical protein